MRVLITGATGFLGKYIIEEFSKHNCEVVAFGRNADIGKSLQNCVFVQGDFTVFHDMESAIKEVDIVIHAGALSTIWGKWTDFEKTNVKGTENVAKACLKHDVKRLIFISSPSVYTTAQDKFDIDEGCFVPNNELNCYIKSKIMAEELIRDYSQQGLYTVVLRPRGLFGIGDTSIIPRLIGANSKIGVPLINDGKNIVDITYVPNVAHAVYLAATAENISGEVFNITNGEPTEFKTILENLFNKIGIKPKYVRLSFTAAYRIAAVLEALYRTFNVKGEPPLTKYTACTLGASQTLNIARAREKLSYEPMYSIWEGIDAYAKWWKENH